MTADPQNVPLILASSSPRRKEILEAHGHDPIVIPADVDESIPEGRDFTPEELTIYLAELKAATVFDTLCPDEWPRGCTILGVDTIVYKDRVIGKPVDEADALDILRSLKNGSHEVISGVCIIRARRDDHPSRSSCADGDSAGGDSAGGDSSIHARRDDAPGGQATLVIAEKSMFHDTTTVRFGDYSDEEIIEYVRANPPYDKSGSYAIQSAWGRHVLEMDGDIENVIGLPYKKLSAYLTAH